MFDYTSDMKNPKTGKKWIVVRHERNFVSCAAEIMARVVLSLQTNLRLFYEWNKWEIRMVIRSISGFGVCDMEVNVLTSI